MKAWCRWCRFRIKWYPRWGAWGTTTGDREHATICPDREDFSGQYLRFPEATRDLHEPVEEKPT